ncbi:hypothetical protein ID866_4758 [Astraeus odoratus]|nr:hypothetical protein ID866_4758 [Astraeus odoratus]
MSAYVYALHDFHPEHEDEIGFRAGEPIEVIERDDQYNDGWWQGRNLEGKVGLFPQSYTTPAEPAPGPSNPLQPLQEEPDAASLPGCDTDAKVGAGAPSTVEAEVMKATMTDVQQAIEQLGGNDRDGARSFSYASSHDADTDRETDDTETDGEIGVTNGGNGWHRSARDKLAQEARKVVEEKAAAEALLRSAPPIEVEMSDESEGEDDDSALQHLKHMNFAREHPHIPEEDEGDAGRNAVTRERGRKMSTETSSAILPREDLPPSKGEVNEDTTPLEPAIPRVSSPPPRASRSPAGDEKRSPLLLPTPTSPHTPAIDSPVPVALVSANQTPLPASPAPSAPATITSAREGREILGGLPSPALTSGGSQRNSAQTSKSLSASKLATLSLQSPPPGMEAGQSSVSASEWTVDDVVEWLKSKNFGQDVCDKFVEQEITGDVLLELDVNLLKAEIGITAFGKRMRIANAIAELRRPPPSSIPDIQAAPSMAQTPAQTHPLSLTPSVSPSYGFPHSRNGSISQSLNSPPFATGMASAQTAAMSGSVLLGRVSGSESPKQDTNASPILPKRVSSLSSAGVSLSGASARGSVDGNGVSAGIERTTLIAGAGLGLGLPRSIQLAPSPSDTALDKRGQGSAERLRVPTDEDDRGALSDGETAPSKQRRRFFGRSTESPTPGKDRVGSPDTSKDGTLSSNASPIAKRSSSDDTSVGSRQSRPKRGGETSQKGTERHSLFAAFPSTIGRSRKPPPRITSTILDEESPTDQSHKGATLSLSRLYRKPSSRPGTSEGFFGNGPRFGNGDTTDTGKREKAHEKQKFPGSPTNDIRTNKDRGSKDSATLTKRPRTLSTSMDVRPASRVPTTLTPGKSVIEQIGEADHSGWLRKKADHYNTWKHRYFIIKGPHLYILRSDTDENIDPGRYGFRIIHETDRMHAFSSPEQLVVREWMKAIMKATIGRDYTKPVVSSVNIPTIPLTVAQAMNPAPRPPSPTARAAMQKALRRENPNHLSARDARVLMGIPSTDPTGAEASQSTGSDDRTDNDLGDGVPGSATSTPRGAKMPPPRPSREIRRTNPPVGERAGIDSNLIYWANSHLPQPLQVIDPAGSLFSGLAILRLAESVVGKTPSTPIADSAFPSGPNDDKLDGLFRLFDFLLDNEVKMGDVSINDIRQGKRDKVMQLLKALKAWEDRRKDIVRAMGLGPAQGQGSPLSVRR